VINRQEFAGYTLIELMVVIAIMMTMLGLVGGGVIDGVARSQAQTEVVSVYSLIKKSGARAFSNGQTMVLSLNDNRAVLSTKSNLVLADITFEYLHFDNQKIIFRRNGLPHRFDLYLSVRGKPRELDLGPLFKRVSLSVLGADYYAA
tara:strand:+ start:23 stop:463 length:441 start_codon:yes stop_codon:yes gene_type:complete